MPFLHGGSGWAISGSLVNGTFGQNPWGFEASFDHYVHGSCCGDAELWRAFHQTVEFDGAGAESGSSFRNESWGKISFAKEDWCQPLFTLHHVSMSNSNDLLLFKKTVEPLISEDDFLRFVDLWDWMVPDFLRSTTQASLQSSSSASSTVKILDNVTSPVLSTENNEITGASSLTRTPIHRSEGSEHVRKGRWTAVPSDRGRLQSSALDAKACQRACEKDMQCLVWTSRRFPNADRPDECKQHLNSA